MGLENLKSAFSDIKLFVKSNLIDTTDFTPQTDNDIINIPDIPTFDNSFLKEFVVNTSLSASTVINNCHDKGILIMGVEGDTTDSL